LEIDGKLNGKILSRKNNLWIEKGEARLGKEKHISKIIRTPRIGVDYAGPVWSKKKWRFILSAPRIKRP
jgi:3-methyladenine DNA glycosylase Mpg